MKDVKDQKEFLHALATPLGTAIFLSDSLLERLTENESTKSEDIEHIQEVIEALQRMKNLLQGHRETLAAQSRAS